MENALRIGLSRQMALQTQMNVIANNLANVNTSGFKRDNVHMEEFKIPVAEMTELSAKYKSLSYVHDRSTVKDLSPGPIRQSGNDMDVAISGEGWFVINTNNGERYTRNGEFKLNAEGILVTNRGDKVLGEAGEITFDQTESGITFARDGTISTSSGIKGKIRIVKFENEQLMKKEGFNLFSSSQPAAPLDAPNLMQGMIEQSNVKPVLELTKMIETTRAYTTQAKMMQKTEELKTAAINKLAQMPN